VDATRSRGEPEQATHQPTLLATDAIDAIGIRGAIADSAGTRQRTATDTLAGISSALRNTERRKNAAMVCARYMGLSTLEA